MTPAALKRWRSRLALSQAGAAEALGISVRTLQEWEQGRNMYPTTAALLALACAAVEQQLDPVAPKRKRRA